MGGPARARRGRDEQPGEAAGKGDRAEHGDEPPARLEHDAVHQVLLGAQGNDREREAERDEAVNAAERRARAKWPGAGGAGASAIGRKLRHTFSTSGRPSRPDGMKMSTMARIENAATSL